MIPELLTALTGFVGREHELEIVTRLLHDDGVRFVSLTGPGGVGKTRFALHAADRLKPEFPDGVVFVSLVDVVSPRLVLPTIARAVGVRDGDVATLSEVLRERRVLLVLDNLEHLLGAVTEIAALLVSCGNLTFLATSRVVLGLPGEHTVAMPPLAIPTGGVKDVDQIARIESVALFVQRARAIEPGFALHKANAAIVARVCERLEGLPLAIELAAVRLRHLPLPALEDRLGQRLSFLVDKSQGRPDRQRSLQNTIAWSYGLLSSEEQTLFRWLSVFTGGATLDAIEAVDRSAGGTGSPPFEVLSTLIDASLVRQAGVSNDQPRFVMLETIREFAREQLRLQGEEQRLSAAHAAYYTSVLEQRETNGREEPPSRRVERLEADLGNLRSLLSWVRRHDESDVELRVVTALLPLLASLGLNNEGKEIFETALARAETGDPAIRARPLLGLNPALAWIFGASTDASDLIEQARSAYRATDDTKSELDATVWLATTALYHNEVDRSRALYLEALEGCERWDDQRRAGWIYCFLGTLHNLGTIDQPKPNDDRDLAEAYCRAALDIFRELDDQQGIARALNGLEYVAYKRGDFGQALALGRETISLRMEIGDRAMIVPVLHEVADIAALHGQPERSVTIFGAAEALAESFGFPSLEAPAFRAEYERKANRALGALGEEHFASLWAGGRALTLEQAVVEAMAVVIDPMAEGDSSPSRSFGLTSRERDVVRLVAKGMSNQAIADELCISVLTVKRHLSTVLAKLNVPSRSALNTFAHAHGLT